MSLSQTHIDRIVAEVEKTVLGFFSTYEKRGERAVEDIMAFFDSAVDGFGTGEHEVFSGIDGMRRIIEADVAATPDGLNVDVSILSVRPIDDRMATVSYVLVLRIPTGADSLEIAGRGTQVLLRDDDGAWRIVHSHISTPSADQADDESIPFDALRARAERLERDVAERTVELSKANRELRIEAALERVRARSMAMRSSDELAELSMELVQQVQSLGVETWFCAFNIYDDDPRGSIEWGSDGRGTIPHYRTPREGIFLHYYDAGQRGDSLLINEIGEDECPAHYEWLCTLPGVGDVLREMKASGLDFPTSQIDHVAYNRYGYLIFITFAPAPESHDIFMRFSKVFEQTYTRFLDLKQAEEGAREARIEAALERVRARTMAMHHSDELKDVALTYADQLEKLGMQIHGAMFLLQDPEDEAWTLWTGYSRTYPIENVRGKTLQFPFQEVESDPSIDAWRRGETVSESFVSPEELPGWVEAFRIVLDASGQTPEDWIRLNPDGYFRVDAYMKYGVVAAGGPRSFTDEEVRIQVRFAREFERTYRRFLDLKKAEAQAWEARIEVALERVRARTMAMDSASELLDVGRELFRQLIDLGMPREEMETCGFAIVHGDGPLVETFLTTPDGDAFDGSFTVDYSGDESSRKKLAGWRRQDPYQLQVLDADGLSDHLDFLAEQTGLPLNSFHELAGRARPEYSYNHSAFFRDGFLAVVTSAPQEHAEELYPRFARVFELAYQRYNDLKKADEDYRALLEEKARTEQALTDLQATQKQLIEQEKLASLGSLTAGIAHEIKNPLNFVNNFAEVSGELMDELAAALSDGDSDEAAVLLDELRQNARQIAKHGGRADSIVRSMMQHARGGSSERETIHVNTFVEEYVDLAWHGMRARNNSFQCDVTRQLSPTTGTIEGQPQELGRVLLNLLNNAFYAVGLDGAADEPVLRVATSRANGRVSIAVSDSGPGIPDDIRDKIFEPFFTTKPTGEGTGLGLSLSYDIVTKAHGGTMQVENREPGGATFIITLPA